MVYLGLLRELAGRLYCRGRSARHRGHFQSFRRPRSLSAKQDRAQALAALVAPPCCFVRSAPLQSALVADERKRGAARGAAEQRRPDRPPVTLAADAGRALSEMRPTSSSSRRRLRVGHKPRAAGIPITQASETPVIGRSRVSTRRRATPSPSVGASRRVGSHPILPVMCGWRTALAADSGANATVVRSRRRTLEFKPRGGKCLYGHSRLLPGSCLRRWLTVGGRDAERRR